jgi:hypothetical protein
MSQLPNSIPPGVDAAQYLNWLVQLQQYNRQQDQQYQQQQQQGQNYLSGQQLQLFLKLIEDSQQKYQNARNDNEKTRNDILSGRTDTRNRILDQWNQYGDSLVNDTNRGYQTNLNNSLAALYSTGLGQSTVNSSIRARNEKERQDSMRRVKDGIIGNYANADERLSNNIDDFQERVTNAYPDSSPISQLSGQLGGITGIPGMLGGAGGGSGLNFATPAGASASSPRNPYAQVSSAGGPRPLPPPTPASRVIPSANSQITRPMDPVPTNGMAQPSSGGVPRRYGLPLPQSAPVTAPATAPTATTNPYADARQRRMAEQNDAFANRGMDSGRLPNQLASELVGNINRNTPNPYAVAHQQQPSFSASPNGMMGGGLNTGGFNMGGVPRLGGSGPPLLPQQATPSLSLGPQQSIQTPGAGPATAPVSTSIDQINQKLSAIGNNPAQQLPYQAGPGHGSGSTVGLSPVNYAMGQYAPMPALGIFGAKVQTSENGYPTPSLPVMPLSRTEALILITGKDQPTISEWQISLVIGGPKMRSTISSRR